MDTITIPFKDALKLFDFKPVYVASFITKTGKKVCIDCDGKLYNDGGKYCGRVDRSITDEDDIAIAFVEYGNRINVGEFDKALTD